MVRPRVQVLMHRQTVPGDLGTWTISELAEFWEEDGIEVGFAFGPEQARPADLLFLHVDLSVVPEEYLALADRYPAAVNGKVADIRKSAISAQLVRPGDGWKGPCIVKSDLNCAGGPERIYGRRGAGGPGPGTSFPFRLDSQLQYPIYQAREEVPEAYFEDPSLVVERFLPEFEDGHFHTRSYHFLGSAGGALRLGGAEPIVIARTRTFMHSVEVPAELEGYRKRMGLDYGKIDYLMHDGELVILDVNKTTGGGRFSHSPLVREHRKQRAKGIWSFLR